MEETYEHIYKFLTTGETPSGFNTAQKFNFKRSCARFSLKDGEVYFGTKKLVKSKEEAFALFKEVHALPIGGHSGIKKTCSTLSNRWYWKRMTIDVTNWIMECEKCQKVGRPLISTQPLQCIKVSAVWELVGIDLIGPLTKTVEGYQYIFTATDYFSKWVEAYPMKTKSAPEVAGHICSLIYRHGCPKRFLSDQGREFVNQLNNGICSILGVERSVTAAYHPQTNGLDEKTNQNIKRALAKLVNDRQNNWDFYLRATLFALRSKMQLTTKYSPFLLMYGREAIFPSEVPLDLPLSNIILHTEDSCDTFVEEKKAGQVLLHKATKANIEKAQTKQKEAHAKKVLKKYKNVTYNVGDEVLLYNMRKRGRKGGRMEPDFTGPYTIQEVIGKIVKLATSDGKTLKTKISLDHIKPFRRSFKTSALVVKKEEKSPEKIKDSPPCPEKIEDSPPCPEKIEDSPPWPEKIEDSPPWPEKIEDSPPLPEKIEDSPPCPKHRVSIINFINDTMELKRCGIQKIRTPRKQWWGHTNCMCRLLKLCMGQSGFLMRSLMHTYGM